MDRDTQLQILFWLILSAGIVVGSMFTMLYYMGLPPKEVTIAIPVYKEKPVERWIQYNQTLVVPGNCTPTHLWHVPIPDCPDLGKYDCNVGGDGRKLYVEKRCSDGSTVRYPCGD